MNDQSTAGVARAIAGAMWIAGVMLAVATASMFVAGRSSMLAPPSVMNHVLFGFGLLAQVGFLTAGTLVVSRRPRHVVGMALLTGAVLALAAGAALRYVRLGIRFDRFGAPYQEVFDVPGRILVGWLGSWLQPVAAGVLLLMIPLVFPSGRLLSWRWRPVAWFAGLITAVAAARAAFAPGTLWAVPLVERPVNPFGVDWFRWLQYSVSLFGRSVRGPGNTLELPTLGLLIAVVLAAAAVGVRYWRTPQAERTPIRWFAASALLVGAGYAAALGSFAAAVRSTVFRDLINVARSVGYLGMAASTVVAIFRHRLFELDVVVRRTAAFGGLSVFIGVVYAATAVTAGSLARGSGGMGWLVSAVGTAVVAAGLEPVRNGAEAFASRVVFGNRLPPFELASQLSRRLAEIAPPEAPAVLAREVGTGIGAQEVLVRLGDGEGIAGRWSLPSTGSPRAGETGRVVVDFRGEPVAELAWTRFPGDTITASDQQLMEAVARQAGPALHSATVVGELVRREAEATLRSAELEASRRRLAEAHLEAQLQFQLDLQGVVARSLLQLPGQLRGIGPGEGAPAALEAVTTSIENALRDVRRLGRGLAPSLLDGRGVVSALRALAEELPAHVDIDAGPLPRVDAARESTLFFGCADLLRRLNPGDRGWLRLEEVDGAITCIATLPAIPAPARQALEDRIDAAGGTVVVGDDGPGCSVRITM